MVFSSPIFLFRFLPFVLVLYFIVPRTRRNPLLLAASLVFYAWGEVFFVSLMLLSIAINYYSGLRVADARTQTEARRALALAIIANLSLLAWFKYANFLADNFNLLLQGFGIPPLRLEPIHLPAGISFFTFQALSYVIDVYRKDANVTRSAPNLALFVSLFPQLIAGPIVRYRDVAEQIISRSVDIEGFVYGVRRFVIGLGKKVLIANIVAVPADSIFGLPAHELTSAMAWLAVICYTLQIYFDFSGYSDMAIGLGRMFGFRFLENFNYPYISSSMTEFWRRWHISLSTWFRDYVYFPLGGNRRGRLRTFANLFIVFFLTGLWHGASWNFVLWGLYHGTFLIVERLGRRQTPRPLLSPIRHLYVLLATMAGWVLFRAETLPQALAFLKAMAGFAAGGGTLYYAAMFLDPEILIALALGIFGAFPVLPAIIRRREELLAGAATRPGTMLGAAFDLASLAGVALIFVACAMQLAASTHNPFIYFRF